MSEVCPETFRLTLLVVSPLSGPFMHPSDFLADLRQRLHQLRATLTTELLPLPAEALNSKPGPDSWSALECLEHLNRYGRHYLPALQQAVARPRPAAAIASAEEVGFSWLGRKSYEMVRPENTTRHATLARMNPSRSQLGPAVLNEFLAQLSGLEQLLEAAAHANLNRRAVPVEFFRLLKLRTGEALLFVLAHAQRHVGQAVRAAAVAADAPGR